MIKLLIFLAIPIGLIWALIVFPTLRIAVVIFVLLVCAIIYGVNQNENKDAAIRAEKASTEAIFKEKASEACRQREEARWSLITANQAEVRDTAITSKGRDTFGRETFEATISVFNASMEEIGAVEAVVRLHDCRTIPAINQKKVADSNRSCEIIGETNYQFEGNIPPKQVRALSGKVEFANLPQAKGNATFSFSVTRVKAGKDGIIDRYMNQC